MSCCYADVCFDGEMRLAEGKREWEGRLEVCLGQRWGTVGSDGWTKVNSQVVCNALGYDFNGICLPSQYQEKCFFLK